MAFSFDHLEGCYARPDPISEYGNIITFYLNGATVTFRIVFNDEDSGADMAITNMTTQPAERRSKGYGSHALQLLLAWARSHELWHIQAVQVQDESENFWIQNGFQKIGNETNDFVLHLT
ncbi:MAG: hypothetical protein KBC35_04230 [Candidatus Pacebacteria bacterium]|nr:hypothetical protein [Candidatus Paceibacterota bacterium]